jgi:hypothetical protein
MTVENRTRSTSHTSEIRLAKRLWGPLPAAALLNLRKLVKSYGLSVSQGDLLHLQNGFYITHAGLLRLAARKQCSGIEVQPLERFCDPASSRWSFKAIVYKKGYRKGFAGYGDADPANVSPSFRGAEMRIAETRAVNRALRKAYGIGICSVEELGTHSEPVGNNGQPKKRPPQPTNGNGFASPARLKDRLCQLIRQHRLDPALVKSYAIDFCHVASLKDAKREQVETFVEHLSDRASKDRDALLRQLNSYQTAQQGAA